MQCLERLGRAYKMEKAMLTAFKRAVRSPLAWTWRAAPDIRLLLPRRQCRCCRLLSADRVCTSVRYEISLASRGGEASQAKL